METKIKKNKSISRQNIEAPILFSKENYPELSNFYVLKTPIIFENKKYTTSEHLYQALKFDFEEASKDQLEYAEIIRKSKTPSQCKILARQKISDGYAWRTALNPIIQEFNDRGVRPRDDWEDEKVYKMKDVLRYKFDADLQSRAVLLSTGTRELIENSPWDSFWGNGRDKKGENHLGKCLMEVRDEITENIKK